MEPLENKNELKQERIRILLEKSDALAESYFLNYDDPDKPLAKKGLMSMLKSEVNGMTVDQLVDFEHKVNSALEQPDRFLAAVWGDGSHGLL